MVSGAISKVRGKNQASRATGEQAVPVTATTKHSVNDYTEPCWDPRACSHLGCPGIAEGGAASRPGPIPGSSRARGAPVRAAGALRAAAPVPFPPPPGPAQPPGTAVAPRGSSRSLQRVLLALHPVPGRATPQVAAPLWSPRSCGGLLSQQLPPALRADPRLDLWPPNLVLSKKEPTHKDIWAPKSSSSVGCWYLNTCVGLNFFHILQATWNFPLGWWRNSPRNPLKTLLYWHKNKVKQKPRLCSCGTPVFHRGGGCVSPPEITLYPWHKRENIRGENHSHSETVL